MTFLSAFIVVLLIAFLLGMVGFGLYHFSKDITQGISGYGVPYLHTPERKIALILENLHLKKGEVFIDVGCGDGGVLEAVKKKFPYAKVIGYEKSYRPYKDAIKRKEKNGLEYEVKNQDFFAGDIEDATVVYSYMINYVMEKIWKKVEQECRPGTLLFSSSFPIKSKTPKEILRLGEGKNIFIYEVLEKEVREKQ